MGEAGEEGKVGAVAVGEVVGDVGMEAIDGIQSSKETVEGFRQKMGCTPGSWNEELDLGNDSIVGWIDNVNFFWSTWDSRQSIAGVGQNCYLVLHFGDFFY